MEKRQHLLREVAAWVQQEQPRYKFLIEIDCADYSLALPHVHAVAIAAFKIEALEPVPIREASPALFFNIDLRNERFLLCTTAGRFLSNGWGAAFCAKSFGVLAFWMS